MDTSMHTYDASRVMAGIKAAGIIMLLGAAAVAADYAFFIAPGTAVSAEAAPPAVAPAHVDGFALPDHLRNVTAADVEPPPPSF